MESKQFVRLVSKANEWYDEGTEVFDVDTEKRMTLEEYKEHWEPFGYVLVLGLRNGEWDEELCPLEEFDITIVEEQV